MFDEALRLQLSARSAMEAAIAAGLAAGEMRLHYQPVLDLSAGRLKGYEALVRWERPGVGMVPPNDFIPVAEESSLVCDLDRWVLHEATRQLAEWRGGGPGAGRGAAPPRAGGGLGPPPPHPPLLPRPPQPPRARRPPAPPPP